MNNCTFAGRAGQNAELRKLKSGDSVANFSLAVDRFKKDDGPLWLNISLWGKQAENLSRYITKGKQLVVSGSVDLQTYTNRAGDEQTNLTLRANNVTLQGGGESAGGDGPIADEAEQEETEVASEEEEF